MVHPEQRWGEAPLPVVSSSLVLAHAADAVAGAVAQLWPGETVCIGPQLPSVTNYVTPVQVGEAHFFAKYSVLGTSLVSVVRGVRGPWKTVETAQRDYIYGPRTQLARECIQLRLLHAHTSRDENQLQVPEVIAYEAGVLITTAVDGPTLATELLREHAPVDKLLTNVVHAAQGLHRDPILARSLPAAALARPHTSITGTFARKFLGPGSRAYHNSLGDGWAGPCGQDQMTAELATVCKTLAPLLRYDLDRTVIYGDLKPEHILLGQASRQTWLDPGLQHCDPCADIAKLISRITLLLVTARPSVVRVAAITDTLNALVNGPLMEYSTGNSEDTLRRLLTLWLADWMNYLATGLSLPPNSCLPLPPILLDSTARAEPLLQAARATATAVVSDPFRAWEIMLSEIHKLLAWPGQ